MSQKILLTGKNGQVGFELQRALAPLGEVVAIGQADCDLADGAALRALVRRVRPDVIVNPAAYTAVDQAETESAKAFAINAEAPATLAQEAAAQGSLLIHFSTDYVFDGRKQGAYTEEDLPNPASVYGRSKLAGEQAIAAATERHVVLRTSWVVGAHGNNFAKTMLRLAAARKSLNVVADQWGAPTPAALLADLTAHLVRQHSLDQAGFPYGLYHVAAAGQTNWCDYARFVIAQAVRAGLPLQLGPEDIAPISSAQYPTPAARPANSRLDTQRFQQAFGLRLPDWQDGVRLVLEQIF